MPESTKKQHYVPQVYLKAWETSVSSLSEPEKVFSGVFTFQGKERIGNGTSRSTILYERNLYTVNFDQLFIAEKCPKIRADFVDKIYSILRDRNPSPVYGKHGYSIIKTKKSIRKHLFSIDHWKFFYDDGRSARTKAILNDIHGVNSYVIEKGLDSQFETKWGETLSTFFKEMNNPRNCRIGMSERYIDSSVAEELLSFFFMMYCRSPRFDGMGFYAWLQQDFLRPTLGEYSAPFIDGIWHNELYKMIYKRKGGNFHSLLDAVIKQCQMILFQAVEGAGSFITSDNPAFQNKTLAPEAKNSNGFVFPLSPQYLIFICKGRGGCSVVDYRNADKATVQAFNQMIWRNRTNRVISDTRELNI